MKKLKKAFALFMAFAMMLAIPMTAGAAGVDEATIDYNKTGSLDIYKYDFTNAGADGVWDGSYISTGVKDADGVENILGVNHSGTYGYAIAGVEFSYLKVADIRSYERVEENTEKVEILYGVVQTEANNRFLAALGIGENERVAGADTAAEGVITHYYRSDTLISALQAALDANPNGTKTALESYIRSGGGVAMPVTDEYGRTSAAELPLGLYLVVETRVPENVTDTTVPFFVSLPMTSVNGSNANDGGERWMYDVTLYPKNMTGMPTLEKTIREAKADTGKSDSYAHTATASAGDALEYQIISTLPNIGSEASYLTEYSFVDRMEPGISYKNGDAVIEFYRDKGCSEKLAEWGSGDGKFNADYADNALYISMTEAGLAEINSGYSGCTMRITYGAYMNSDSGLALGDKGNANEVTLTWRRTNEEHYDTLRDDCHVYSYGIDLVKQFSDGKGDFSKVSFVLNNDSDNYFVTAKLNEAEGVYYVTGHTAGEKDATRFVPNKDGSIFVCGLEDDTYRLTEVQTSDGYNLLKKDIKISITTSEAAVCELCGKAKLTAAAEINGESVTMKSDGEFVNALAGLTVINTKGFDLPQTGSYGNWMFPVIGLSLAAMAAVVLCFTNKKKH